MVPQVGWPERQYVPDIAQRFDRHLLLQLVRLNLPDLRIRQVNGLVERLQCARQRILDERRGVGPGPCPLHIERTLGTGGAARLADHGGEADLGPARVGGDLLWGPAILGLGRPAVLGPREGRPHLVACHRDLRAQLVWRRHLDLLLRVNQVPLVLKGDILACPSDE